jgi:hypothetical protein
VAQTIRYTNLTGAPLYELTLVVEPNRVPGVFHLHSLARGDGTTIEEFDLEEVKLRIPLPGAFLPRESLELELIYDLNLPDRSGAFGHTPLQVNLGDWYPYIPPYRDEAGWQIHRPWAYGEHLVYGLADYQVTLDLVGHAAESGTLTVAASAPPARGGPPYRYHLDQARSFAFSVSPSFVVQEVDTPAGKVIGYTFAEHESAGEAAVEAASEALNLYSELFGPYPHGSLSVVEASFGDGMEYDGLIFVSQGYYHSYDGSARNYLTLLSAHETAHQWWYGLVGNDQAMEPWLDEALSTYGELLYYERFHPDDVDWWWLFRVNVYGPQGWMDGSIYDYDSFRSYVNATYLRGAQFLDQLRATVGDETFLSFLKAYADRFQGRQATGADFFSLLVERTGGSPDELIRLYFRP